MEMEKLEKQLETAAGAIAHVQKRFDDLAGKVEGLDAESIKNATDVAGKAMEESQKLRQESEAETKALKQTIEALEKTFARGGNAGEQTQKGSAFDVAFGRYVRKGIRIDESLVADVAHEIATKAFIDRDEKAIEVASKALAEGSSADGGYWLMPERANFVMTRVFETSPMRSLANVVTTGTDSLEIIIDDDEAEDGGWVGEVDSRSDTGTPQIGKLVIPVHEIYAQPKATQRMLDDAGFDLQGWLQGKISRKFGRSENSAFISGSGASRPKGILSYADASSVDAYQRGKIGTLTTAGSGVIAGDDLILLQNALKEEYQGNSTWLMKRSTFGAIATLKDTAGQYIFQTYFLNGSLEMQLLGRPIVFADDMQAVTANALSIAYGDFNLGYTIVDRFGIRVLRDEYTQKPFVKYYSTKRVGGDVTSYDSFKRLRIKA